MDYYGLLFLYYLKGLSGKSVLKLFFNVEVGGTEQLLPENTSTPTTTPILADIQYPDGLRTDQYFTYRETPTTVSNKARIKTIKGQTLKWNQLVQNGNFADTSGWKVGQSSLASISASSNVLTYKISSIVTAAYNYRIQQQNDGNLSIPVGHKVLVSIDVNISKRLASDTGVLLQTGVGVLNRKVISFDDVTLNAWVHRQTIYTINNASQYIALYIGNQNIAVDDEFKFRNFMLIDLTEMFGAGNEPSTVEEFTSLFPLSYYSYNQGTLLSFNGNGIKTVGKNLFDEQIELGTIGADGNNAVATNRWRSKNYVPCFPNTRYVFSKNGVLQTVNFQFYDADKNYLYNGMGGSAITTPSNAHYLRFFYDSAINVSSGLQLEFGTTPSSYEPYASSTLSLPISTYFTNGMNGHGDTYDELTSAVATKRFEKNSLGDLTWTRRTTNIFSANLPSEFDASKDISCFMSNRLPTVFVSGYTLAEDGYISIYKTTTVTSSTSIYLNMASQSIDTVADLQTWLSNNPTELVYPLATPIETPITTEDANEALSLLMGRSVSSSNAKQMIDIITKGE